jgi:hypothetical protein
VLIEPGPLLSHRLQDEIESLGLGVTVVAEPQPPEPLEATARAARAVAAIRVTQSGTGAVEMTIVDRTTGKTVSRRLSIATPSDPAAAELIATRTVELLRASLMELAAEHPTRGDVTVTPEIEALKPRLEPARQGTLSLALGPALAYSQSLGTAWNAWAALTFVTRDQIGVTAQLSLPVTVARLQSDEGEVAVSASVLRLGAVLQLGTDAAPLIGRFQAGLALARLAVSGTADAPAYVGAHDDLLAWGPWIGAAVRPRLSTHFSAVFAADAGLSFPRTVIRSAGREVTTWGRPLVTGVAGLEVTWP